VKIVYKAILARACVGIVLVLGCGVFLFLAFAFSTMIPPELMGKEWLFAVLSKMYRIPTPGIGTIPATALFVVGIGLVFHACICGSSRKLGL
jgi:hypothetical protein